jgi:hypothetical protein
LHSALGFDKKEPLAGRLRNHELTAAQGDSECRITNDHHTKKQKAQQANGCESAWYHPWNESLKPGALKIMAWTKSKTAVLAGAILIAVLISAVVGFKLVHAVPGNESGTSELSPTMMRELYIVGADGSVSLELTIEESNNANHPVHTETINDLHEVTSVSDGSGRPIKVEALPVRGLTLTFNEAVPPGQKISYTLKTSLGKVFEPSASGDYVLDSPQQQGNDRDMRLIEVWRLPAGATLVTNSPPEMTSTTNSDGQIEVRLEKVVPPNGTTPIVLAYRLGN